MTLEIAHPAVAVVVVFVVGVVETCETKNVKNAWKKVIIWTKLLPILSVLCVDWLFEKTCLKL